MGITVHGVYLIKDSYFERFDNGRLMQNKKESRPVYYAIQDKQGIFWMVPFSSRVEKYKATCDRLVSSGKKPFYAFGKLSGREAAFLVLDMFPVSPDYIAREYQTNGRPYIVHDQNLIRSVEQIAFRYLNFLERGILQSPANVLEIRKQLLEDEAPTP